MEQCKTFFEGAYYHFMQIEFCWVPAGTSDSISLFGVSDYLAALALLIVIYTITDFRNKFRLSLSPLPIYSMAFWVFVAVGLVKTLSGLWFYYSWPIIPALDSKSVIDAVLIVPCVLVIFYWVFVSFVYPPTFSKWNCRKFFWVYRRVVHNGTEGELRIALQELARSVRSIVKVAVVPPRNDEVIWKPSRIEGVAHDFLLLLANRRLCAEIVKSSPDTAAAIFREVREQKKTELPFETFAKNVAVEFLSNKSSPIYHEDSGWESGWSGYAQLYSSEIFSDPIIVSSLASRHSSPLDIRFSIRSKWDAENWEAYSRVALLYFERVIDEAPHLLTDFSINQIFENCKYMFQDVYKLDGADSFFYQMDEYRKLEILTQFVRDLLELLDDRKVPICSELKPKDKFHNGVHEKIAELIVEIIFAASKVRSPTWTCWEVQHNTVWSNVFGYGSSATSRWVFRRVCRLIYKEILDMDRYFNFKGASYLGFCLNVLGLDAKRREGYRKEEDPLRLGILEWTRRNYARMRDKSPKPAQACLQGSITFDEETLEFVKTYSNETGKVPNERRFKVDSL